MRLNPNHRVAFRVIRKRRGATLRRLILVRTPYTVMVMRRARLVWLLPILYLLVGLMAYRDAWMIAAKDYCNMNMARDLPLGCAQLSHSFVFYLASVLTWPLSPLFLYADQASSVPDIVRFQPLATSFWWAVILAVISFLIAPLNTRYAKLHLVARDLEGQVAILRRKFATCQENKSQLISERDTALGKLAKMQVTATGLSRAKQAFARLHHPDRVQAGDIERLIRTEIFKEFWSELERIERDTK